MIQSFIQFAFFVDKLRAIWLPSLCEILGNMCIVIVCKPGYEAMNFEVNMIKKSWQEIKYLENEKSF